MKYELRNCDKVIATFSLSVKDTKTIANDFKLVKENEKFAPLDLQKTNEGIAYWLKSRTIPKNRAYADNFLAKFGLSIRDIIGIIKASKCLSLTDTFWVVESDYKGTFNENNLFTNRINKMFSEIAFTGHGSISNNMINSSPEFTTNGMFPKAWRRIDGKLELFKAGTTGFANAGKEPHSEFYAYQVAKTMGLDAVEYNLNKWKGELCSTCKAFTNINESFIPAGNLIKEGGIKVVLEYYKNLGDKYFNKLIEMFVFDAIIANSDRHLGNFGFIINNRTNAIKDTAPIFDNGLSLLYNLLDSELEEKNFASYVKKPSLYDDYFEFVRPYMTTAMKNKVRKLINFKFKKNARYNLDSKRLKKIEEFIQLRVKELIK